MKLSSLQKYILLQGLGSKKRSVSKRVLSNFYKNRKKKPKREDQVTIVTRSVERLISSGLVKGRGVKTKDRWFISEVILTPLGSKEAKKLLGQQLKLPLKNKKNSHANKKNRK